METKKQELAESLRQKFKAEAVQAIEASQQSGYFDGSASMDTYITTLKRYCDEIEGQIAVLNPKDSSLRTALIKAMMERCYELLREEFSENRDEVLAIKQALLSSSKSLAPVVEAALPLEVYRTYARSHVHEDLW
jgi:flagellar biosynthesis/type III secretory pathway protein FliH